MSGRGPREGAAGPWPTPLQRFLDDAALDAAGGRRTRRRLLAQLAVEESTLVGALRDLVEQGSPTAVSTVVGRTLGGRLCAVGRDHVVVQAGATTHLVALEAIAAVRGGSSAAAHGGARGPSHDLSLRELLAGIAGDRPDVVVYDRTSASGRVGQLAGVGIDVLILKTVAERSHVLVPIAAISEVVV